MGNDVKVALLSDIHANRAALDAVFSDLQEKEASRILVAGDLIGYYYWPYDVVSRLIDDERVTCIRGNHEDLLKAALADEEMAERYHAKYGSGVLACQDQLDPGQLAWLDALPVSQEVEIEGVTFHLSHGGLRSTDRYLYPDAALEELAKNYSSCDFTVFGHTHYAFTHQRMGRVLVNPGSVGQPRDRGGAASYAIVDLANGVIRPQRVPYDYSEVEAAAQSRDAHLPYLTQVLRR